MAMQAGFGLSKILLVIGAAGYTGTIVLRNGRLSEILAELQGILNEKSTEGSGSDQGDALASQIKRLAMEVRQLASARPVTVVNGNSGNMSTVIVPAATIGALGYGYMWWKGLSFSDLMYVTKKSMANAVSNMTKHMEQVSAALAATKRHLTQRIENLDGKLDEQKEISREIKSNVADVRGKISNINYDINSLQELVYGLDGKINAIDYKQKFTCEGVMYLCQVVQENGGGMPDFLQNTPKLTGKPRYMGSANSVLKGIALAIESGNFDKVNTEGIPNDLEA